MCKAMSHGSYKKAQRFRETGEYPSRSDKSSAFLGHTSDLEVIMPFYNVYYRLPWKEMRGIDLRLTPYPSPTGSDAMERHNNFQMVDNPHREPTVTQLSVDASCFSKLLCIFMVAHTTCLFNGEAAANMYYDFKSQEGSSSGQAFYNAGTREARIDHLKSRIALICSLPR
jgi:hypothetical protein